MGLSVWRVAVIVLTAMAALAVPGMAAAAPPTVGYDVSYPQCRTDLPRERAFAVVGVNGGLSTRANPCLREQLIWAWNSSGGVEGQPRAQVYLNTANPGQLLDQVTTWPERGSTPYGSCDGTNTAACSWQYGWERAQNSVVSFFTPAARAARVDSQPSRYVWWLDVETVNTWQFGSAQAFENNRATLEGMTEYLLDRDAQVGIYSTHEQWSQIVGAVGKTSVLAGLDNWLAGSVTAREAAEACAEDPLVPGSQVALSQYVRDELDRNKSCR
jgi:hypothetical protein